MSQVSTEDGMYQYAEGLIVCMRYHYEKENFAIELGIKNTLSEAKWWNSAVHYVQGMFEEVDPREK